MNYAAASAKVRALLGGILNESDYDELISKNSVSDIASYLKNNTVYGQVFSDSPILDMHRGSLEILLKKQYMEEADRIYRHLGTKKDFFYDLNMDVEIEFLKSALRGYLIDNRFDSELLNMDLKVKHRIPLKDLIEAETADEFLVRLKKCDIGKYIYPLVSEKNPNNIHAIESNLDMYYFINLDKSARRNFKGKDLAYVLDFIGKKADIYNIVLILRAKKYYNWSRELIIPHIINIFCRLTNDFIYKLADSESYEECLTLLKKTQYANLIDDETGKIDETRFYLKKYLHKIRRTNSIKAVLYYFKLKSADISNITTITEAVRYGYAKGETKKLVVCK